MGNNGDDSAIRIAVSNTHHDHGRVLAAIPRSNSQTSPRVGGIFCLVQEGEQSFAGFADLLVAYGAGVQRKLTRPAENFQGEGLLVVKR